MNSWKTGVILIIGLVLTSCGRSPDPQFYMLNPIPFQKIHTKNYHHLRIGLTTLDSPGYMSKPQIIVHSSVHQVELKQLHQWASSLNSNVERVIATNLATLLPGATIEISPWEVLFKPNYKLHIEISQFEIDTHGNSILRADYLIYTDSQLDKTGTLYYHLNIPHATLDAMVASMNDNLTHLTRDIANVFKKL